MRPTDENALQPTQRGYATALAAQLVEALTGTRQRLHWCVDLDRIGVRYRPSTPLAPGDGEWPDLLQRFRGFLDRQPWWEGTKDRAAWWGRAKIAITVNLSIPNEYPGIKPRRLQSTYDIPWSANFTVLCGRPPPVGTWRVWAEPPALSGGAGPCEGDLLPTGAVWQEVIPF